MSDLQDSHADLEGIANQVIVVAQDPSLKWLGDAQRVLIEHRKMMDDTYIAWAVAINGTHVAIEKYSDSAWTSQNAFYVTAIRSPGPRLHEPMIIRRYLGADAAEIQSLSLPHLTTWGFVEYYGKLEELVFALFRCFLDHHPTELIDRQNNRELFSLYRNRNKDEESGRSWRLAWTTRVEEWQRKRLYDGLHSVLRDFLRRAEVHQLEGAELTPGSWTKTLNLLSEVRNSLVHGNREASPRLAQLVAEAGRANAGLHYQAGDELVIRLVDLWKIELFGTQLTSNLQVSIGEKAREGPHEIKLVE